MRFKNLTIILTLTCLSIVAFAGLVLLPITNGLCASWSNNDIGSRSKETLFDNYSMDATYRGWSLSASVSAGANTASASASPSITGEDDFTETYAWIGYANTYVQLYACTVFRLKWWSSRYHKKIDLPQDPDSASGELRAKVVIAKQGWGSAKVKIESDPSTRFTLNAPIDVFGEVEAEISYAGNIYIQLTDILATYDVNTPTSTSASQDSRVSGSSRARKSATINSSWFGTQSIDAGQQVSEEGGRENYDDATAKYVPPPLGHGFVEGSMGWLISYW